MTGVIVAGMHRSGTSLMASFVEAAGFHPGERLLSSPTEAYREDEAFVSLHRRWLERHLPPGDGHRDWGISSGGLLTDLRLGQVDDQEFHEAEQYFCARSRSHTRWFAKDPRASLFLPVWSRCADTKFVFVYRNPWDVVDSAVRLGAGQFCSAPRLVRDAWLDYNTRILSHVIGHPSRSLLIAAGEIVNSTEKVWEELTAFLGIQGPVPLELIDRTKLVQRGSKSAISRLYEDLYPHHSEILHQLDCVARIPRAHHQHREEGSQARSRPLRGGQLPPGQGVQVVIPCRDDGDFLAEAVASVDDSPCELVELSIVNDGSTDPETLRILDVLRATGRDVIDTDGIGLSAARNLAVSKSHTLAVLPLDADNRVRSALLTAVDLIESGSADVVHGAWQRFGMQSARVDPPEMELDSLVWGNSIDACALIRRDLLKSLGGWDENLAFWEDWDLWLGAVEHSAKARRLDEVTFDYLVRPGSMTHRCMDDQHIHRGIVEHVTHKHRALLGDTTVRLVRTVHELVGAHHHENLRSAHLEAQLADAQSAFQRQIELHEQEMLSLKTELATMQRLHSSDVQMLSDEVARLNSELSRLGQALLVRKNRINELCGEVRALRSRRTLRFVDSVAHHLRRLRLRR